jgi:class 3 adenylate cyclase
MDDRERIEQSIAALEAQRSVLGDQVVDLASSALGKQLADLETQTGEQRKQVTVLFADLQGLAALSERMDAEELGGYPQSDMEPSGSDYPGRPGHCTGAHG